MNDTKHESTQRSGWVTPENSPAGWNPDDTDRLAAFERGSRERSAASRAQREGTAERVEIVEVRDVTDPSRVYTPLERQEPQQTQEHEANAPAAGWEASQPLLDAAEVDAEILQREAVAERNPERAAAMAEIEQAFGGHDQSHDIER